MLLDAFLATLHDLFFALVIGCIVALIVSSLIGLASLWIGRRKVATPDRILTAREHPCDFEGEIQSYLRSCDRSARRGRAA
jgi:xanthine/uracil permease